MRAAFARVTKTGAWCQWWTYGAIEAYWGVRGGPRCPLTAATSASIAALLSGRFCGPQPCRRQV
eukprot:522432-Lingulodinium_polyedra.AAC.1